VRPALLALALAIGAAGCGDKKPVVPSCEDRFLGDPGQPPEGVLVVTDGISQTLTDIAAGAAVPLVRPPQGGQVTYAAARVRNVNRCHVQFRGRYRDPTSGDELGFDGRTLDLVVGDDGWGRPDARNPANFDNIAPCPDPFTDRDIQGTTALLEITIVDAKGRTLTLSQPVVPTCMQGDPAARALCVCECSRLPADRMRSCSLDGGI
jgi:hypothetical protein